MTIDELLPSGWVKGLHFITSPTGTIYQRGDLDEILSQDGPAGLRKALRLSPFNYRDALGRTSDTREDEYVRDNPPAYKRIDR